LHFRTSQRIAKVIHHGHFTEGVICDAAEEVLLGCVLKLIDKLLATTDGEGSVCRLLRRTRINGLEAKENRPIEVDEPLRTPAVLRVIPGGSCPLASDHAIGGLPPVEVNVWLYGALTKHWAGRQKEY